MASSAGYILASAFLALVLACVGCLVGGLAPYWVRARLEGGSAAAAQWHHPPPAGTDGASTYRYHEGLWTCCRLAGASPDDADVETDAADVEDCQWFVQNDLPLWIESVKGDRTQKHIIIQLSLANT